jgi:hypothetical protein
MLRLQSGVAGCFGGGGRDDHEVHPPKVTTVLLVLCAAAAANLASKVITGIFSEHVDLAVVSLFSDLVFACALCLLNPKPLFGSKSDTFCSLTWWGTPGC